MSVNFIVSQFFGLLASIVYLWIFLFIFHNALIRLTRFKSLKSKAVSNTIFIVFTGSLYTFMGTMGFGSNTFVLPSHLFLLGLTWAEYFRDTREVKNNG